MQRRGGNENPATWTTVSRTSVEPAESSRKWIADGLVPPLDRTRTIPIPSRRCRSDARTAAAAAVLRPIPNRARPKSSIKLALKSTIRIVETFKIYRQLHYCCCCYHGIRRIEGGERKRVQQAESLNKQHILYRMPSARYKNNTCRSGTSHTW